MKKNVLIFAALCLFAPVLLFAQIRTQAVTEKEFRNPPASAKPWVFWYWMQASVSKQGITADLEAMKQAGIGGAYLMPIKDTVSPLLFSPPARQLSNEWWGMVNFSMQEAKRLGLQLGMHVSDGFALAGGPWISPELSMQKLVWTREYLKGNGQQAFIQLKQPKTNEEYYKDVAVFAYPAKSINAFSEMVLVPSVTTSGGKRVPFLSFPNEGNESFKSDTNCWVQYEYPEPFACRSVTIHVGGNNYQAQRLIIQTSDDGENFSTVTRLEPPRHGWQDTDEDVTYAIPYTMAKFFRFVYDKDGAEPGAEDLDAAKWKPSLKIMGIYLSDEPVIHQYESKNGSIWRVSKKTTQQQLPDSSCTPLSSIIDLTSKMDQDGRLNWTAPDGNWVIMRIGHTSTGHTNATGGAGKGLECDKFNPRAIRLQFDNWFGRAFERTDKNLAQEILKVFHVDSWECGSQNWSATFPSEFKKRRGYDLFPYLLAMTGTPVQDAITSEKFLHDVRQTIAELINDTFYGTLRVAAKEKGCSFSAESVAPTMVSDGMLHYNMVDLPMGEFWMNSPTHDKPNDMLDAISAAHIYGKNIIQAEAFTSIRMNWGEHPGNLKAIGDRNFALGINKMVLHVFAHNPWMNRKPGMTLDGVGVYFQRDQTWWKQGKAWMTYLQRCQYLLQLGKPVVDIAVFTGEEIPARSLLPDRLVSTLPGIFGNERMIKEKKRLQNEGTPLRQIPAGVNHSANMADPEDWIDPLNGYAYDSFNPDALLNLASVKDGRIVLPGGASYAALVIPVRHPLQPDSGYMSLEAAKKIRQMLENGATILMNPIYRNSINLNNNDDSVSRIMQALIANKNFKGKIISLPYTNASFKNMGLEKDVENTGLENSIAWTHRRSTNEDIYFIANQQDASQVANLSFRITGMEPELWDPVTGNITQASGWEIKNGRTYIRLTLEANASVFVLFRAKTSMAKTAPAKTASKTQIELKGKWSLAFDKSYGGPATAIKLDSLKSWTNFNDERVKYYSGTATYKRNVQWTTTNVAGKVFLVMSNVDNIATVSVNGKDCGTVWTAPYKVDISSAIKKGNNTIEIRVTNTWANRLIGDSMSPQKEKITWTTAPFRLKDKPLLKAGLSGTVFIETVQ
jgi:hypothetical protein